MTPTLAAADEPRVRWIEWVGVAALIGFVATLQFSIAAAEGLLALAFLAWIATLAVNREPVTLPAMFWPLVAYAAVTLVSVSFSLDPPASVSASRQLLLFLAVPIVYRLARGARAESLLTIILT